MAIKVTLAAALLVALVALAAATTYTTTVTTTTVDGEANPGYRQCSQQLQGRQFRACQSFLSQRGSPYGQDEDVLEMTTGNQGRQQYGVEQCCQQLRQMDRQGCGCEAVRQAARQAQQGSYGQQTGQSQQVYQKAQQLPRICQLREQQCQFHVVFV